MSTHKKPQYKIAFVGEPRVGKTSLFRVLFGQTFNDGQTSSLGPDFLSGEFTGIDGTKVILVVWDTAGQDTQMDMTSVHLRSAALVLITFNLCDISTSMKCSEWAETVRREIGPDAALLLVGTQRDRVADRRVSPELAHDTARLVPALVIETSSKSGENIDTLKGLIVQLCTASQLVLVKPANTVCVNAESLSRTKASAEVRPGGSACCPDDVKCEVCGLAMSEDVQLKRIDYHCCVRCHGTEHGFYVACTQCVRERWPVVPQQADYEFVLGRPESWSTACPQCDPPISTK